MIMSDVESNILQVQALVSAPSAKVQGVQARSSMKLLEEMYPGNSLLVSTYLSGHTQTAHVIIRNLYPPLNEIGEYSNRLFPPSIHPFVYIELYSCMSLTVFRRVNAELIVKA